MNYFDNSYDEREIMNLLEQDMENSFIEAEEKEKDFLELQEKYNVDIEEAEDAINEFEENTIDMEGLIEFLSGRDLLTDNLKWEIEYYKKCLN